MKSFWSMYYNHRKDDHNDAKCSWSPFAPPQTDQNETLGIEAVSEESNVSILSSVLSFQYIELAQMAVINEFALKKGVLGIYQCIEPSLTGHLGFVEETRIITNVTEGKIGLGSVVVHICPVVKVIHHVAYYIPKSIPITYPQESNMSFEASMVSFSPILGIRGAKKRTYAENGKLLEKSGEKCSEDLRGRIPRRLTHLLPKGSTLGTNKK